MPEAGACSAASQSPSLGQFFPGILLLPKPKEWQPYQDFADAVHGVAATFWRRGIHCTAHAQEAQDLSETPDILYMSGRVQLMCLRFPDIQQHIQSRGSWISRCEICRKMTSSSNSNQINFQAETILMSGEIQM